MSDKGKSAAGRVLSELYHEDRERRVEPAHQAEPARRDEGEDREPRGERAA